MLRKEYEEVTETITHSKLVNATLYCDVCKKVIPGHYWQVATHHSDWGNDSIESYIRYDCCSPKCLTDKFEEYLEFSNSHFSTMEFEVEHITRLKVDKD